MTRLKVLIVSHNFPKSHKDMHGKRCASINKYLQKEDIKTSLLTSISYKDLSDEIIDNFNVKEYYSAKSFDIKKWGYKTKILVLIDKLKLNNLFFFPDMSFTWIGRAYRKGKEIINHDKYHLIYAIMNPYTSFVVAYKLAKKHNIPLVLDYSDPYSCHPFNPVKNKYIRARRKRLERKIFDYATLRINIGKHCAELTKNCLDRKDSNFKIVNQKEGYIYYILLGQLLWNINSCF